MSCAHPIPAWHAKIGNVVTLKAAEGDPDRPVQLPCGKCLLCLKRSADDWVVRLVHEAKCHNQSVCMTLSYDDEHLPEGGNLCPRDVELFIKRLRKHVSKETGRKVRYFYVGEYGTANGRPHYHFLLFGYDFSADRQRVTSSRLPADRTKYKSDTLSRLWGNGLCDIGSVNPGAARYVMKYLLKADRTIAAYDPHLVRSVIGAPRRVEVLPFHRQSSSPGIGGRYLDDCGFEMYLSDVAMYKTRSGVVRAPMPRYYDRRFSQQETDSVEWVKARRIARAKEKALPIERLMAREEIMRLAAERRGRGESDR